MNAYQPKETQTYGYDNSCRSFDPTGTLIFGYDAPSNWLTRFNFEASPGTAARLRQFTGKERDAESGLDYFGARYYGSALGRFTSPDLLGGHIQDPQSLNKYMYARNNPLRFTDSTGLDFYLDCKGKSDSCQGGHAGTTTTDADGKSTFTATVISNDKNGGLVDQNGNQYSGNFDEHGAHFTSADGTTSSGSFVQNSNATVLGGAGVFQGFTGVFNDNCRGTCVASGSIFGTQSQFANLEANLKRNPGIDAIDPFHPGSTQYRYGNPQGPDPHLSDEGLNGHEPMHYDGRYPYAGIGGFLEHTGSVLRSILQSIEGHHEVPPPATIPQQQ
jgi:RHS repeat-associated protein